MIKIGGMKRCLLWSEFVFLFSFLTAGALRAQEIRPIAEPNQSIRMGRGGYICEGHLTHTPIDATEDWTYEMVQCTGPIYNSNDYVALNTKLNHDELVKLNTGLDQLNATSIAMQAAHDRQVQALGSDLRTTIEKKFQALPKDVLLSVAVQNLKVSFDGLCRSKISLDLPELSSSSTSFTARQRPGEPRPESALKASALSERQRMNRSASSCSFA
jgi:hypothetical protein